MRQVAETKVEIRIEKVLRTRESAKLNAQIECAIAEFFDDYVVHSDVAPLNTWFVKDLFASRGVSKCFQEALKATALRSKVNKNGCEQLAVKADEAYGTALALLAKALQNPAETWKDSTLGAAYVIGLCEVFLAKFLILKTESSLVLNIF
jgi:hypothetical protein